MEHSASTARNATLRQLAYVYHPTSFPTFSLVEAADGLCNLLWVLDFSYPEARSMARLLARLGEVIDVTGLDDAQAAEKIAARNPDGILALADSRLSYTARVACRLELPFFSSETAATLTDKHAQRAALQRAGVPVPGFVVVPPLDDTTGWDQLEHDARFPGVLKPRFGEGSRDTFRVASLSQVRVLAEQSERERPGRELVLEEYLRDLAHPYRAGFGGYVSVECVVSDSRVYPVAITGRFPPAEPFRETGFFIPASLPDEIRPAVLETACESARALGISTGCLHIEIKFTPDGPRVIEVNGRLGGGIPEMLRLASGIDLYPIALALALGDKVRFDSLADCKRIGWLLYEHAPYEMREVVAVEGLDKLRQWPEVVDLILNRGPGSGVDWREGNHGHVYSVLGVAQNHDHLLELERRVHEAVVIQGV